MIRPSCSVLVFTALAPFFIPSGSTVGAAFPRGEYLIVSGGPSLYRWEKYKDTPHDRWWGNFIRTARVRMEQLQAERGADYPIGWLVYKPGYITRSAQEGRDLIALIESVREKYGIRLIYFNSTDQLLNYINAAPHRGRMPITGFEYYGHSNKACFMFDYSNIIDSASKAWLHEAELRRLRRSAFHRNAYIKSWGCHTGESMSKYWRLAVGIPMIGAIGKTDYSPGYIPVLSSPNGRWAR
jgi:hypothetical protein